MKNDMDKVGGMFLFLKIQFVKKLIHILEVLTWIIKLAFALFCWCQIDEWDTFFNVFFLCNTQPATPILKLQNESIWMNVLETICFSKNHFCKLLTKIINGNNLNLRRFVLIYIYFSLLYVDMPINIFKIHKLSAAMNWTLLPEK